MELPKNLAPIKIPYRQIIEGAPNNYTPRTYQRAKTNKITANIIGAEAKKRRNAANTIEAEAKKKRNSAARKIRIAELQTEIAERATMEELDAALERLSVYNPSQNIDREIDYTEELKSELQGLLDELEKLQRLENSASASASFASSGSMCAVQRKSRKTRKNRKAKKSRNTRK
jgi:hypothetical protein